MPKGKSNRRRGNRSTRNTYPQNSRPMGNKKTSNPYAKGPAGYSWRESEMISYAQMILNKRGVRFPVGYGEVATYANRDELAIFVANQYCGNADDVVVVDLQDDCIYVLFFTSKAMSDNGITGSLVRVRRFPAETSPVAVVELLDNDWNCMTPGATEDVR